MTTLSVSVTPDEATAHAATLFDYPFDGTTEFVVPEVDLPREGLGLIVGPSGSGKSTLLHSLGTIEKIEWPSDKAIVSAFSSPEEAVDRLMAVGLNTIPAWFRPYRVLSTGEQFRADLARQLGSGALIDEFTSVVDRNVARAASVALARYVRERNESMTLASCHRDIIEWLAPDWIYDTLDGSLVVGRRQRRPSIELEVFEGPEARALWPVFRPHHYLSASLLKNARCFVATWEGVLVGFSSAISMPSGTLKNAWRGHRTVVLPDYQGMGIGVRLSDYVGAVHTSEGKRYFSRTAHPRMGEYRNKSPLWRATSKNRIRRADLELPNAHQGTFHAHWADTKRVAYSHEYIGEQIEWVTFDQL